MRADTGPIGGDLSHEFIILASTGESEVFCHRDYLEFETPPEDIDFDDAAVMQGVFDRWTSLYAATSEKHEPAAFEALPRAVADFRPRHRGRPYFLLRDQILPADESRGQRARRQGAQRAQRLLRHRSDAARRRARSKRTTTRRASSGRRPPRRSGSRSSISKVGDAACDGACERIYAALEKAGVDVLYDDRDERPRRQIRRHGPDRRAAPGHRRTEEPQRGQGRVEARRSGERELVSLEAAIAKLGGTA